MVGLVLVSHSRALAEAACRLAKGVNAEELPIAFAGGTGDDFMELGTDATDIMAAIQDVNTGDGVLVLMDLGSAVLSARMAEELLAGDVPGVRLCPAPLVEGAVAAAVQIAAGARLDDVYREAVGALAAKTAEMDDGSATDPSPHPAMDAIPENARRVRFVLDDPNGLHARPAAALVKALSGFDAQARIRNQRAGSAFVNARSLNQLALANICGGDVAEMAVWGPEAEAAFEAVETFIRNHGRDAEDGAPAILQSEAARPESHPARLAPGVATGRLYIYDAPRERLPVVRIDDPDAEVTRFDSIVNGVVADLHRFSEHAATPEAAAIMEAQALILDDAEVMQPIRDTIRHGRRDAASTFQAAMDALVDRYRALDNPYMRERAADVRGVAGRVIDALTGRESADPSAWDDVIVWSREVTPVQTGEWRPGQLKGILTESGGPTSHVAILAAALGIPAITGYLPPPGTECGVPVAMDADRLEVAIDPDSATRASFSDRQAAWKDRLTRDAMDGQGEARTRDGVRIPVLANVSDGESARTAHGGGAEGIGLLRSEFLFLGRTQPPTEREQIDALSSIMDPFATLPVTVRTLDIGGDKPLAWLRQEREANPFLGVRGVRLTLAHRELFVAHLRAILQAGHGRDLEIMVPMISLAEEVEQCRGLLMECHSQLQKDGVDHAWPVRFGIMVETPAAVLQADRLAGMVDFFSIGSNDLVQYVMCAERGDSRLTSLADAMQPAVLRAIGMVCEAAAAHALPVAVCGEMAGDTTAVLALLGLGVNHLSVNPAAIGGVKRTVRQADTATLRRVAREALALTSAREVRALYSRITSPSG